MDGVSGVLNSLSNISSPDQQIAINMLSRGMDEQQSEVAQLLQGLPAPQPAYLGSSVNVLA